MPIEAKVAAVLNTRDVAISKGDVDGVKVDDIARIVHRTEINDPDTNELLGTTERTIVRLQITSTAERFAIARTYETFGARPLRVTLDAAATAANSNFRLVHIGDPVVVETPTPAPPPDETDLDQLPF